MKRIIIACALLQSTPAHAMQFLNYARQAGARLRASYAQASAKLRSTYNQTTSLVPSRVQARSHGLSRFSSSSSNAHCASYNSTSTLGCRLAPYLAIGAAAGIASYSAMQSSESNQARALEDYLDFDHENFRRHSSYWATEKLIIDAIETGDMETVITLGKYIPLEKHIIDHLSQHKDKIQLTLGLLELLELKFESNLASQFVKDYAQCFPKKINILMTSKESIEQVSGFCLSHTLVALLLACNSLSPELAQRVYQHGWKMSLEDRREFVRTYVQKFAHNDPGLLLSHKDARLLVNYHTADIFQQLILAHGKPLPLLASRIYHELPQFTAHAFIRSYVQKFVNNPADILHHTDADKLIFSDTADIFAQLVLAHDKPLSTLADKISSALPSAKDRQFRDSYLAKFKQDLHSAQSLRQRLTMMPAFACDHYQKAITHSPGVGEKHSGYRCKEIFSEHRNTLLDNIDWVTQVQGREQEEQEKGNHTFVHGQTWSMHYLQDLYKMLWNAHNPNCRAGDDFTFVRFEQPQEPLNDRADTLWLNYTLLGNPHNAGESSWHYTLQNKSIKRATISCENLFENLQLLGHYRRHKSDFDHLEQLHRASNNRGNLIVVSVTPEQLERLAIRHVKPGPGTPIPAIVKGTFFSSKTTDIKNIMRALQNNPASVDSTWISDPIFTLPITSAVLDPKTGPRFYNHPPISDQKKFTQYQELYKLLYARLLIEEHLLPQGVQS